jgi:uncharacterized membrane protein
MSSRWLWLLRQIVRRLWFRAALFSVLAAVTAILAALAQPFVPAEIPGKIGSDSVDNILGIIASSMLAVTTFSLSTMVAAYAAATSNVTPRATKLLIQDPTTQNALATFIGAFLYSVVGIVALSTGIYGSQGRVILFAVTILVILAVVVTLLRWIDHLARLGRVADTTQRIEETTIKALRQRLRQPNLGGAPLADANAIPEAAAPLYSHRIGYVQHVDIAAIADRLDEKARLYLLALPGAFVDKARPLARIIGIDAEALNGIRNAFTVDASRSFDQDPRFGLAVLSEIASKALSPALNDPGTAIDVIGRAVRVLSLLAEQEPQEPEVKHPGILVPGLSIDDMFDDIFGPIARDGAAIVEVQLRLQKALASLAATDPALFGQAARRHSRLALKRAEAALILEEDRALVREAALP